jgi:hypothetical protein
MENAVGGTCCMGNMTDVCRFLVGKHVERMPKHRWEDNSEMDFKGLCWCWGSIGCSSLVGPCHPCDVRSCCVKCREFLTGWAALSSHKGLLGRLGMMCNKDVLWCVGTQWQFRTTNFEQNGIVWGSSNVQQDQQVHIWFPSADWFIWCCHLQRGESRSVCWAFHCGVPYVCSKLFCILQALN